MADGAGEGGGRTSPDAVWSIPLFDTDLGAPEQDALREVLASGWLTMGDRVRAFEERFAALIGVRHALAVSSCTAGLHLVNLALGLGAGDEAICPSLTFVAGPNSILYTGATPVFADLGDLQRLAPSVERIEACITPRTRLIQVMHYAGQPCPMDEVVALARRHGLRVVEDCAHAPGAAWRGRACGAWGDAGVFSFFSNKNLTTGEGGMVTTDDPALHERMRLLRSHGMTSLTLERHRGHASGYDVVALGHNFRMDEMRAALGTVQLDRLAANNRRRAEIVRRYRDRLADVGGVALPFADCPEATPAHHIFPVLLDEGVDRPALAASLKAAGIQTSVHYPPSHLFTLYRERFGYREGALPLTEAAGRRLLTLPLYPAMSSDQVDHVCARLHAGLAAARR